MGLLLSIAKVLRARPIFTRLWWEGVKLRSVWSGSGGCCLSWLDLFILVVYCSIVVKPYWIVGTGYISFACGYLLYVPVVAFWRNSCCRTAIAYSIVCVCVNLATSAWDIS